MAKSKTKPEVSEDLLYDMAQEAANEVESSGMELSLAQYIEYLEMVQTTLSNLRCNAQNDLKRSEG